MTDHLSSVARSEAKEGLTVARSIRGRWAPKLSAEQRQEIIELHSLGMPIVHIAAGANVNRCTIHRILAQHKQDEVKRKAEEKATAFEAMCQRVAKKNKLDITDVRKQMAGHQ